jgi:hypothetical protein
MEQNLLLGQKFYSAILVCPQHKGLYHCRVRHSLIACERNFTSGLISFLCNFPEVFKSKF